MSESERIRDQFERAWDGDAWHGTPLRKLLLDVAASGANDRPVPGAHTIAEIVLHLAYWKWAVIERIAGAVVLPSHEDQWPPVRDANEAAWRETLALLDTRHHALMKALGRLGDEQLSHSVAGKDYNVYVLLHGVLQHELYHAGQIALLKRAVRT
jgi:uncharacterized damage-inducible protein DinB